MWSLAAVCATIMVGMERGGGPAHVECVCVCVCVCMGERVAMPLSQRLYLCRTHPVAFRELERPSPSAFTSRRLLTNVSDVPMPIPLQHGQRQTMARSRSQDHRRIMIPWDGLLAQVPRCRCRLLKQEQDEGPANGPGIGRGWMAAGSSGLWYGRSTHQLCATGELQHKHEHPCQPPARRPDATALRRRTLARLF